MTVTIYQLRYWKSGNSSYYYVGKTSNLKSRMKQHCTGTGAAFTKKLQNLGFKEGKPEILDENVPDHLGSLKETIHTYELMIKYGINNVRGAAKCELKNYKDNLKEIAFDALHWLMPKYTKEEIQEGLSKNMDHPHPWLPKEYTTAAHVKASHSSIGNHIKPRKQNYRAFSNMGKSSSYKNSTNISSKRTAKKSNNTKNQKISPAQRRAIKYKSKYAKKY